MVFVKMGLCVDCMNIHNFMAVPKHTPLLLLPLHSVGREHHVTTKWSLLFARHCVGTPQRGTLPRNGFLTDCGAAVTAFPAGLSRANPWPSFPTLSKHIECWLYPSSLCPFFGRKKSIEIDLKMSNLINCQLSLQDRYFMDGIHV